MYKNNKTKTKQKYRLDFNKSPDTYLPLPEGTNLFSVQEAIYFVAKAIGSSTGTNYFSARKI